MDNIRVSEENTEKVMSLIEALEDLDDVQNVYHNLDIQEQLWIKVWKNIAKKEI